MVHYIIDRDSVENIYNRIKSLSELSAQKKALLQKNHDAIVDPEGNIPEKYQGAYKKLESECERLGRQLDSGEEVLLKVTNAYVQETAMGNLVYENSNDGPRFFEDVYTKLYDENFSAISAAIDAFDLKKLDNVVNKMRHIFLEKTFDKYREYSKTLSFNR